MAKKKKDEGKDIEMAGAPPGSESLKDRNVVGVGSILREPVIEPDSVDLPVHMKHQTQTVRRRKRKKDGSDDLDANGQRQYEEAPSLVTADNMQDYIGYLKAGFRPI